MQFLCSLTTMCLLSSVVFGLPQSINVTESPATLSGKATLSAQSKHLLPKPAPCVLKKELQFSNNPDTTNNCFSISNNEIHSACGNMPCFHVHAKQTTPSTDESMNEERASPTHEVPTDFARCNVCLADVWLEALQGPTKRRQFSVLLQCISLRNNSNDLLWISHSLLFIVDFVTIVCPSAPMLHCLLWQLAKNLHKTQSNYNFFVSQLQSIIVSGMMEGLESYLMCFLVQMTNRWLNCPTFVDFSCHMSHLSSLCSLINLILRVYTINNFVHVHLVCITIPIFRYMEQLSSHLGVQASVALLAEMIWEALLTTLSDAAELACTLK